MMRATKLTRSGGAALGTALLLSSLLPWATGAAALENVAREDTLVFEAFPAGPGYKNYQNMNPFAVGNDIRNHVLHTYEPLFYWSHVNDAHIPFLATGYSFNDDFTEATVELREGVSWNDGNPFTADDVVFTFELLRENGENDSTLLNASEIAGAVTATEKVDEHTVLFKLKQPDPRFVYRVLSVNFTKGFYPMPKHVFETVEDPANFTNYDADKGWPISTGPYKVASAEQERIILDRRDDWWGVEEGVWGEDEGKFYTDLPAPKRLITVPLMDAQTRTQAIGSGSIDWVENSPVSFVKQLIDSNPDVITSFTGSELPYGYIDWWPSALWFNHDLEKFKDVRVRRAMSYAVDREQIIEIVHEGGAAPLIAPLPEFEAMKPYLDDAAPMAEEKRLVDFDLEASARLMEEAGYAKNGDGFWEQDGKALSANIIGSQVMESMGPIVAEQLRRGGFDVTFGNRPDYRAAMYGGEFELALWGHNGGTYDPYETLEMFHSRNYKPIGESTSRFFRWNNPEVDAIADEVRLMQVNAPEMREPMKRAIEIWMDEVVSIPIAQWYVRVPVSNLRWVDWPTSKNPYAPLVSGHWTSPLVVHGIARAE